LRLPPPFSGVRTVAMALLPAVLVFGRFNLVSFSRKTCFYRMNTTKSLPKGRVGKLKTRIAALIALLSSALLITLLAACAGVPRSAWGDLGRPSDPVPLMQGLRTGTLPSGLRYFILENAVPENRALIRLVANVGSLHEEDHELGISHFVEHMAFRRTERFPVVRDHVRGLAGSTNAFASFDRTVYWLNVPVETAPDGTRVIPAGALALVDDWTRAIVFDPEYVDLERRVIVTEYHDRMGAGNRIWREWRSLMFRGSRFVDRYPMGCLEIINAATPADLENFYRTWYRADNLAVIFVGDFDGAALQASLAEHFLIEAPDRPTPQPVFEFPAPRRGNLDAVVMTDPELTATQIVLYFRRAQEPERGDIAAFRESLIDGLIGQMVSLRFSEAAMTPESPFMGAAVGTNPWWWTGSRSRSYVMRVTARSGRSEEALTELLRTKEAMRRHGFHGTEIALAKESIVAHQQRMVAEKDRQPSATHMDWLTDFYLVGGSLPDFEWMLHATRQLLPGISARDINNAVRAYFATNDILVGVFAPESERDTVPGEARVRQLVAGRGGMAVERPGARVVADRFLQHTPERGSVIAETLDAETGATVWELGNGARVILYPTENSNDEIILRAMARGGTLCVPPEDSVSAQLAVQMLQISGLGPWSVTEVTRMLAARQVSFTPSVGRYTRGFNGSATTGDLQTLFEMLHLGFTDPRIDPRAVETLMDRLRTSLPLRVENPQTVFTDEFARITTGDHPRYRQLELADLPHADIDTALAFLRRGFNPADFTFVFVGNLTPQMMRNYVETYLASIPRGEGEWNTWTDLNVVRPGNVEHNVFAGMEEQSTVRLAWYVPAAFSEQLNISTWVLQTYLGRMLSNEMRGNLGGVHHLSTSVSLSAMPRGEMSMVIHFRSVPERVQELSNAVLTVVNEAARATDQTVFDGTVEALRDNLELGTQNNVTVANHFVNSAAVLDLPLSRMQRRPRYLAEVTPAEIRRIAALLLQNGPAKVVLFPEAHSGR